MQEQSQISLQGRVFGHYCVEKKMPFRIVQAPFRKFSKYERDGHWNQKERLKYTVFLGFFRELLEDTELKKHARVYEMMSDMIITRNPSQCRSHHQKMEKYRSNIPDIIASVTHKYEPSVYTRIQEKYTLFIKALLENADKYVRTPIQEHKNQHKQRNQGSGSQKAISKGLEEQTAQKLVEIKKTRRSENLYKKNLGEEVEEIEVKVVKQEQRRLSDDIEEEKKKQAQKKTQEDYEDDSEKKSEPSPQLKFTLKEEAEERRVQKLPSSFGPHALILPNPSFQAHSVNSQLLTPLNGELPIQNLSESVRRWREEREFCVTNSNHFLMQWNACQQYIRMCDRNINYYEQAIGRHNNS